MTDKKLWQITLTEEQLCVLMNAVEDWHRFICGQCAMEYATAFLDTETMHKTREILCKDVETTMFPELAPNQSYSWCGGHPNKSMSKVAAISYMIYRQIRHKLTLADKPKHYTVYESETLRCAEQGQMIKVELVKTENE